VRRSFSAVSIWSRQKGVFIEKKPLARSLDLLRACIQPFWSWLQCAFGAKSQLNEYLHISKTISSLLSAFTSNQRKILGKLLKNTGDKRAGSERQGSDRGGLGK
jgi:hypothetical protein